MLHLSPAERRALRARAHHLNPLVMIGEAGLTPNVVREIDIALKSHELIKVRVLGEDRAARRGMLDEICQALDAAPVQKIGKILVVFRPKPEQPANEKAAAPRSRGRKKKEPRRTKRSYQSQ